MRTANTIQEAKSMKKKPQKSDATHLTLDERKIIETGIGNGATKADIGRTIRKDATTVAKEIRKHRRFMPRNTYGRPVLCEFRKTCPNKPCLKPCETYQEPRCNRRDRSPGACNGCPKRAKCPMDKYDYNAAAADETYRKELVACREGINLTTDERDRYGKVLAPLLKRGQSVHQILSAHPEIALSERTVYAYIESGVFKEFGVDCFSLKEQVGRKQFQQKYKKRKEPANYTDRRYEDFLRFCEENPDTPITEMDTVWNDPAGPCIQTFSLDRTGLMIGFLHMAKTSVSMAKTVDLLQQQLGPEMFSRLFPVLLTDRGPEFEVWNLFEQDAAGATRLRIFYCDPMQSNQKPRVENGHNYVREIMPNGYPLEQLTQALVNLMFSHINSTPRRVLNDKSPFELFTFFHGTVAAKALGITEIPRDQVTLKPELIFHKPR
jgi:IS30 family transposase